MKNLDPKYLARRESNVSALETEFQKPGSVVFLGTVFSGFTVYGVTAMLLVATDILLKVLN
jgi:hypothetical protein